MNRFFLVPPAVYEQVRLGLDAAWQHPNGRAETCLSPSNQCHTHEGNILTAVRSEMCDWPEVSAILGQLLANNTITEITEADYFASLPPPSEQ